MTKDEALKLALEELELCNGAETVEGVVIYTNHTIHTIKQALAAPVQKPMHPEIKKMYEDYFDKCFREFSAAVPENFMDALKFDVAMRDAAPVQPVALKVIKGELCYKSHEDDQSFGMWIPVTQGIDLPFVNGAQFYTTLPAQRTWVDLTDEEVVSIEECALTKRIAMVMTAATLKEKNDL